MICPIGKRILELLEQKNMTQRELARRLEITEVSVSRYINGERIPHSDVITKMAEVLNTTTDYLLGRTINDYAQQLAEMQNIRKRQTTGPSPAESFIKDYKELSDDDKEKVIKELFNFMLENNKKR
jgi:transcriptional regulator with XRE-family HTH domain